jgi:hypothetical protein
MARKLKVLATSLTLAETAYRDDGTGTNALSVHFRNPNTTVKMVGNVVPDLVLTRGQEFVFERDLPIELLEQRDIAFVPVEAFCYLVVEVAVTYSPGWLENAIAKAVRAGLISAAGGLGGWVGTSTRNLAGGLLDAIGEGIKGKPAVIGRAVFPIEPATMQSGDLSADLIAPADVRVWPGNIVQTDMSRIKPVSTRTVLKKGEANGRVVLSVIAP